METPLNIGISACLLGQAVRYDGGHKLDAFLTGTLGRFVTFVPVCPETECGLGVPREAMRLVGDPASPRLVTIRSGIDHTEKMQKWSIRRVEELAKENLCGFIFKSRSPSSGMERVKVYAGEGAPAKTGVGLFAKAFMERFPLLPVEDEGRLHDPVLRENWITRIFVLRRWRELLAANHSRGGLVAFHTRHKLLLLSHSEKQYRAMGKLVAAAKNYSPSELFNQYETLLMETLRLKSTKAKHGNVLLHALGHFKKMLSSEEKQEMVAIIDSYRKDLVPLIVPITLLNHYVRKYREPYLAGQVYLNPHPLELKLRNHV
ncbi:YbgA family protein [Desulfurivibrio alkaliphilus]|uniref:DUF1722 domain-containing protein n=1 Tax=Desulfurivibrio alkaliphilus (strain DSM 19089 / UNIQEM U267 / AHT2) TaxID=589865 RepID=D6Z117_DESAT|nr:DUF523 and DUF1722 domain-containing protein [Desulfurivibrio alkaliphilus]ADH87277.1 protein of unknown function DUF523 [Desulfurivibrio alkaliphilus AHT 2]